MYQKIGDRTLGDRRWRMGEEGEKEKGTWY